MNWKLAVEKLSLSIHNAHEEIEFMRVNCKRTNVASYESFATIVPSFVFGNLALASDKTGGAPLRSAELYRAYLAYDLETQSRRQIEGRIGELEKAHKAYVAPICSVLEALVDKLSFTSPTGPMAWDSEVDLGYLSIAVTDCLRAFVLIGDMPNARSLEARVRSGFLSRHPGRVDPAAIDLAYARAYRALGREGEAASYATRAAADKRTIVTTLLRGYHEDKPEREKVTLRLWDAWPSGGRAGGALFWYATLDRHAGFFYGDIACPRRSVEDIAAYLAAIDPHQAAGDRKRLGLLAENHACAAMTLANYWLHYQQKIERYNGRRP